MREILFRGIVKDRIGRGSFAYGSLVKNYSSYSICETSTPENSSHYNPRLRTPGSRRFYKVIPESIGQFTGLLDKHVNKIFEGDIVKCEYSSVLRYVEWCNKSGAWQAVGINSNSPIPIGMPVMSMGHVEVIGNIHDNAELLGGGE